MKTFVIALTIIISALGIIVVYFLVDTIQEKKTFTYLDDDHRRCKVCGTVQRRVFKGWQIWDGPYNKKCNCKKYLT